MARVELFIWWTGSLDCDRIGPQADPSLPEYVRVQYAERYGRAAHCRLFVDKKFGNQEIPEWPNTSIARMLQDLSVGGVVFSAKDLPLFKDAVGGIVTDFKLRMMVVKP
jgi:hypothetical protein